MKVLSSLENIGFKITWKLVKIGLCGFGGNAPLLSYDEIIEFLIDCIGRNGSQTEKIIDLICENNDKKIEYLLNMYSAMDTSIESIQLRKWKAYLLKNVLDAHSYDYFQDLLALMEFWTSKVCPEECPREFPDNTEKSLQNYFTESNYRVLQSNCLEWLNNEIMQIRQLESDVDCI